jgi:hypothetical protein
VSLHRNLFSFTYLFPNLPPPALSRDAEEKKEEKKGRKRRKTGQTTPGPHSATAAIPAMPQRVAGEEEDRVSTDV